MTGRPAAPPPAAPSPRSADPEGRRLGTLLKDPLRRVLLGLLLLVAVWFWTHYGPRLHGALHRHAVAGLSPVEYILLYVGVVLVLGPIFLLDVAAGVWFGLAGVLWVIVGATLGAAGAFLCSRRLTRGVVERFLARHPRWSRLREGMEELPWQSVALIRISHVLPFSLGSYLLALAPVRLGAFLLGTLVGMLPGTIVSVGGGALIGDLLALPDLRVLIVPIVLLSLACIPLLVLLWTRKVAPGQETGSLAGIREGLPVPSRAASPRLRELPAEDPRPAEE